MIDKLQWCMWNALSFHCTISTRCMYSQCMPHAHLNNLWINTCGLVSRHGMCFWDCRSMHVQQSGKSVRRRAKCTYHVERVLRMWAPFWTPQNARIWLFLKTTTPLFALLGAAVQSRTHRKEVLEIVVLMFLPDWVYWSYLPAILLVYGSKIQIVLTKLWLALWLKWSMCTQTVLEWHFSKTRKIGCPICCALHYLGITTRNCRGKTVNKHNRGLAMCHHAWCHRWYLCDVVLVFLGGNITSFFGFIRQN